MSLAAARSFARVLLPAVVALVAVQPEARTATPTPPRLAVVITIDQSRADYLERFAPFFGEGGFRRLKDGGSNYVVCHYEHSSTKTAVGHATILTGAHPSVHGIVANDWVDAATWQTVNSVADPASPVIGGTPNQPGRSPRNLLVATVGDQLKEKYGEAAKVFGVANKDRSAILPPGQKADAAYWLGDNDHFVSSHYYFANDRLPEWVEALNAREPVASYFGREWERVLDPADYDRVQGPDDADGEFAGLGLGRTFPRTINGGKDAPGREFSDAFDRSPFALEIVDAFARALVAEEHLGADDVPDLLCVGFSQIDTLGHDFGPDSHEIMDAFIRLDRIVAGFLTFLDEKVGRDRYVVVITADHGIPPLPERIHATRPGMLAARVDLREIDRAITAALDAEFGPTPESRLWWRRDNYGYRFSAEVLAAKNLTVAQVAQVAQAALIKQPAISHAFTAENLARAPTTGDSVAAMHRRSQFPPRSPDVVFALRRYHIDRTVTGTNHGTHHEYDTHVPMLWYGPGVPRARITKQVGVTDIAPTLAGLLGVDAPPQASGRRLF